MTKYPEFYWSGWEDITVCIVVSARLLMIIWIDTIICRDVMCLHEFLQLKINVFFSSSFEFVDIRVFKFVRYRYLVCGFSNLLDITKIIFPRFCPNLCKFRYLGTCIWERGGKDEGLLMKVEVVIKAGEWMKLTISQNFTTPEVHINFINGRHEVDTQLQCISTLWLSEYQFLLSFCQDGCREDGNSTPGAWTKPD